MLVYLDNCCFNRPYDEQEQETVRLETQAKLMVQTAIHSGTLELLWSFILDFENAENPYTERREAIAEWKALAVAFVGAQESIREKAKLLEANGIKSKDALHLACAIAGKCDYFLTTDKKFIKNGLQVEEIKIINPIDFIYIQEETHEN